MKRLALLAAVCLTAAPALAQTPYLVHEPVVGRMGTFPTQISVVGERIFYLARDQRGMYEPWVSDGTREGTIRVGSPVPGEEFLYPQNLIPLGGRVCFNAFRAYTWGMWCSDGTPAGTQKVGDMGSGHPSLYRVFKHRLYFQVFTPEGSDLWSTDGTPSGTHKDVTLSSLPGATGFLGMGITPNRFYLWVLASEKAQLWTTTDVAQGFTRFSFPEGKEPDPYTSALWGDRLLFNMVEDGVDRRSIWITDGTSQGTVLLRKEASGSKLHYGVPVGNRFVFTGDEKPSYSGHLFVTDGTAAGTRPLGGPDYPGVFFPWKGELWFKGGGLTAEAFWTTDGTPEGTRRRFAPPIGSFLSEAVVAGDRFYFTAQTSLGSSNSRSLFVSDGTAEGSHILTAPGLFGDVSSLLLAGSRLFFVGRGPDGMELWALSDAITSSSEMQGPAPALALRSVGARSVEVAAPAGAVRVEAFDVLGRRAALLHDGEAGGTLRLSLPAGLGAGAYLVRATAASGATATLLLRAR